MIFGLFLLLRGLISLQKITFLDNYYVDFQSEAVKDSKIYKMEGFNMTEIGKAILITVLTVATAVVQDFDTDD